MNSRAMVRFLVSERAGLPFEQVFVDWGMRLEDPSDELIQGRLLVDGQLNDPMTGGPLYCRILAFDGYCIWSVHPTLIPALPRRRF
jgi:hypothetical protein